MTDLHSHILFGIDDGSSNIEESLALLDELSSVGFDNVILTPHYISGSTYACNNHQKEKIFNTLKDEIKKNNIDINIYLGNEVYISDTTVDDISIGNIYTLNNSKYLLFEIPMRNKTSNLMDYIYDLREHGYIPILAHPERYVSFQDDYSLVDELKEENVLFQCNYASILGYYGNDAKKLLIYMLKKKYVDYLGTDIHHIGKSYVIDKFYKIDKEFKKIAGNDYYNEIINNGDKIIKEPNS